MPTKLDVLERGPAPNGPPPAAGERIVTAQVLVIGIGEQGITGLPFDPAEAARWISDWVRWGLDGHGEHRDRDRDKDGSCFGDGFDKDGDRDDKVDGDRDDKDGVRDDKVDGVRDDKVDGDRFGENRTGLAAPVVAPLADGWDDRNGWDDKNGRDDKNRRDDDADCIVAGGVVGVGGVGVGGVGGVGAGGAGGGALPFTGVETGAMASIAVALLGGGVLLRVAARRRRLAGRAQD